jgi:prophage regulatory protein
MTTNGEEWAAMGCTSASRAGYSFTTNHRHTAGREDAHRSFDMEDQPDRILRIATVLTRTGLSRSTLYRKVASGSFPRSVGISMRCVGWRESDVRDWLHNPMFYSVDDR